MWEVGRREPGVEAAEPEIVPPLAKGASELQQAGADVEPVVPAQCFMSDHLPCVVVEYPVVVQGPYEVIPLQAGMFLGGRHIGVTPGELGHKGVPQASICSAPSEEG